MGGKGGGGKLPDYDQLIKDSAYYNRMGQIGPTESLSWNKDRSVGARVLNPAEQLKQELSMGLANTAMGTLLGWYGGDKASFGQFDPLTGSYQAGGGVGGEGYGPVQAIPPDQWNSLTPDARRRMMDMGYSEDGVPKASATGSSGITGFHDPYGEGLSPGGLPGGIGGGYEGLGYGDQGLLKELIDSGYGLLGGGGGGYGGGGGGSWSMGGGGVAPDYSDLTQMVTFDENGNPNIGPGFAGRLNEFGFDGFDQYLPEEGDLMAARDRAEQASFDRMNKYIQRADADRTGREREMLINRGVGEGSEISGLYRRDRDTAFNEAISNALLDAVGQGRQEHSMLWGQGMQRGQSELQRAIQDALLQNTAMEGMIGANLSARGMESQERQAAAALAAQNRASGQSNWLQSQAMDLQRLQMALQGQNTLFSQQMAERGLLSNELFTLAGFGAPTGMGGYWQPGQVDVNGASNAAMQNAMFNFQSNPLTMAMSAGTTLGSAFLGAK